MAGDSGIGKNAPSPTIAKSSSESSIAKRKLSSKIDQELLLLERDEGNRHSRQLSEYFNEYAKKIEQVQSKNRLLEEELSFDSGINRNDPYFSEEVSEKICQLDTQGNQVMVRLELCRKEVARLNNLIKRYEGSLAHQRSKLYELAAFDHNHNVLFSRVRKMENEIDRRIVRMNEKLSNNRKLRAAVDAQRSERARMDAIYTKIATESLSKRHKVEKLNAEVNELRQEVAEIEQQLEDIRQEGEDWEMECDKKATAILQEIKEIAIGQHTVNIDMTEQEEKETEEEASTPTLLESNQDVSRSTISRGRWKIGQTHVVTDVALTKYQENRSIIEKINEVTGTTTVSGMIEAFKNQESEQFEQIQRVNQLAEEIESHRTVSSRLREEIGKLKQRKDSADFQRLHRIKGLHARLQSSLDQKSRKDEANGELQSFLAALRPTLLLFHSRIGCPENHSEHDIKTLLGDIEEQVLSILQKYHAKVNAKHIDEDSGDTVGAEQKRTSSRVSTSMDPGYYARNGQSHGTTNEDHWDIFHAPSPLDAITKLQADVSNHTATSESASPDAKPTATVLAKDQPYRYRGLRPPHLSVDELRKKDNVEEEYPLTYGELKDRVWQTNNNSP